LEYLEDGQNEEEMITESLPHDKEAAHREKEGGFLIPESKIQVKKA